MFRKFFFASLLLLAGLGGFAQNYITLHEDCNYRGKSYTLGAGTYSLYQMKIGNDLLSSMQIPQGFKVTLYADDDFRGGSKTFTGNISCLEAEWNDKASSIVVENNNYNGGYGQNDYVTFYNDSYQRGYSKSLRAGSYTGAQLAELKYNISSFTINGNLRVRCYLNSENLTGYYENFESSQSYLSDRVNDKIGSLVIEYYSGPIGNGNPNTGNPGNSGSYASFYTDCNYEGNAIRLLPGYYDAAKLGLFRNNISSVQIPNNLRVKAFTSDNLYGNSTTLTDNSTCLEYSLKGRIGSIVVEERRGGWGNNGGNNPPTNNESVVLYSDDSYRGQSATLLPGTYATMAQANGFPTQALSSIQVPAGYRVVLYEYENFGGKSYTITASKSSFSFTGWNDRAMSVKVFRN